MITNERLQELCDHGREASPFKAELQELVAAYRCAAPEAAEPVATTKLLQSFLDEPVDWFVDGQPIKRRTTMDLLTLASVEFGWHACAKALAGRPPTPTDSQTVPQKDRDQGRHIRELQAQITAKNEELKALRAMISADTYGESAAGCRGRSSPRQATSAQSAGGATNDR